MNTDLLSGLFGLALTVIFWLARGNWFRLSAIFPNTILVILGLLSVALLVKAVRKPDVRALFTEGNRTRIAVGTVAMLVWIWLVGKLGFFLGSLIAFCALTVYVALASGPLSTKDVITWIAVAVLELGILHYIFSSLLRVPLPRGIFG